MFFGIFNGWFYMLLVWRGWGIGVPLIVIVVQLLTEELVDYITGTHVFIKTHSWVWLIGLSVSAIIIWFIGQRLDMKSGRIVLDKETQRELKSRHDFSGYRLSGGTFLSLCLVL